MGPEAYPTPNTSINQNNYVYNNGPVNPPPTYSQSSAGDVQRNWSGNPPTTAQCYIPESSGPSSADPQIQDLYQFSPLSGDLFQPEEIFQLDQPLNQGKVHRLQSPPQTLLDLGSGTIQLKGTVVTNNNIHPENNYYHNSYESLPPVDNTAMSSPPSSGKEALSTYQYQASIINCGPEKSHLSQFPATSGYCETTNLWKDDWISDENGNHLIKAHRVARKMSQQEFPPFQQSQLLPPPVEYHHHYRSQEAYSNNNDYQMSCHETQLRMMGSNSNVNPCYANSQGTGAATYFTSSSSAYLPQAAGLGAPVDQSAIYTSNKV